MIHPASKNAAEHGPASGVRSLGVRHPDTVAIYVYRSALAAILEYSHSDQRREVGGFMLGGLYREKRAGREYVEVGAYLPAPAAESGPASLKFTHDSWAALTRRASAEFPDMLVLGWHHTHPGLGVFLSGYDVFIHRNFFSQPWQFALVVDPKTREMGFFQWRGGEIVDCGFTLLRDK